MQRRVWGTRMKRLHGIYIRDNYGADDVVVQEIYVGDEYRLRDLKRIMPSCTLAVDVGAHIGVASYLINELWPTTEIIACEMMLANAQMISRNVPRATVHVAAVTYHPNTDDLLILSTAYPNTHNSGGSTLVTKSDKRVSSAVFEPSQANGSQYVRVPIQKTTTLEDMTQNRSIDLLKLDCEGTELDILQHSRIIQEGRCKVIVGEYHGRDAFLSVVQHLPHYYLHHISNGPHIGSFWLLRNTMKPIAAKGSPSK